MVFQTFLVLATGDAVRRDSFVAAAHWIEAFYEVKERIHGGDVAVWTEIRAEFLVYLSRLEYPWQIFVGNDDARIGFTVFQQYVVPRTPLFYEIGRASCRERV